MNQYDPNDSYQIWDGTPQCPICDAPLEYWTCSASNEREDLLRDGVEADGALRCCRCEYDEYAESTSESLVLEWLFDRVALEYKRAVLREVEDR